MSDTESPPGQNPSGPAGASMKHCRNCGAVLQGEYCHECGQQDKLVVRFFPILALETLEGLFAFESKTYLTLWYLFTRPAWLTREYLAGRRARYLPPVRLFLVFVLAFLFTVSLELFLDSAGIDIDQNLDESELVLDDEETASEELDLEELESGVTELLERVQIPFLSEQRNNQFISLLQERAVNNIAALRDDPSEFIDQLLESVPLLLLVMIPLLALLQKLIYLRSDRYYVEHLLLTINNHSFLFLVYILLFLLDLLIWTGFSIVPAIAGFLGSALNLWVLAYLFLSLRLFFAQGFLKTTFKFVFISTTYGVLLIIGALLFSLVSFFIY
jgi:hypothetical protein